MSADPLDDRMVAALQATLRRDDLCEETDGEHHSDDYIAHFLVSLDVELQARAALAPVPTAEPDAERYCGAAVDCSRPPGHEGNHALWFDGWHEWTLSRPAIDPERLARALLNLVEQDLFPTLNNYWANSVTLRLGGSSDLAVTITAEYDRLTREAAE